MIYRPCPLCLDSGRRQTVTLGAGYVFTDCELCFAKKSAASWKAAAKAFNRQAWDATREYCELTEEVIKKDNEIDRFRKALEAISDVRNAMYQLYSASYVARKALGE